MHPSACDDAAEAEPVCRFDDDCPASSFQGFLQGKRMICSFVHVPPRRLLLTARIRPLVTDLFGSGSIGIGRIHARRFRRCLPARGDDQAPLQRRRRIGRVHRPPRGQVEWIACVQIAPSPFVPNESVEIIRSVVRLGPSASATRVGSAEARSCRRESFVRYSVAFGPIGLILR